MDATNPPLTTEAESKLTDKEIFTKIWLSPRLVFKYLNDNKYDTFVPILLILSGIVRSFDRADLKNFGDKYSLQTLILLSIIAGGVFGWMYYYVYSAGLKWTGRWLGGRADFRAILRTMAYGSIPMVATLGVTVLQILIFGNDAFKSDSNFYYGNSGWRFIFLWASTIAGFVLSVWTLVLLVVGLSEVQKFSIGKAILNFFLPVVVLFVGIGLIVLITKL